MAGDKGEKPSLKGGHQPTMTTSPVPKPPKAKPAVKPKPQPKK